MRLSIVKRRLLKVDGIFQVPEGITHIGDHAFSGCKSLTKVLLPETLSKIGYSAFSHCTSLTDLSLPETLTKIDNFAFHCCWALKKIDIKSNDIVQVIRIIKLLPWNLQQLARHNIERCKANQGMNQLCKASLDKGSHAHTLFNSQISNSKPLKHVRDLLGPTLLGGVKEGQMPSPHPANNTDKTGFSL